MNDDISNVAASARVSREDRIRKLMRRQRMSTLVANVARLATSSYWAKHQVEVAADEDGPEARYEVATHHLLEMTSDEIDRRFPVPG